MGVCNCSMFCCTLLYVHSSIAIILMGKRELVSLLNLSSLCLVMVGRLFLTLPQSCLQFVIVVFPDHTHLLFFKTSYRLKQVKSVAECLKGSICITTLWLYIVSIKLMKFNPLLTKLWLMMEKSLKCRQSKGN